MTPFIGLGGTFHIATDRYPVTVVALDGDRVGVRFDAVAGVGLFVPADTSAPPHRWFVLEDATYRQADRHFGHLTLGTRERFHDPTLGELSTQAHDEPHCPIQIIRPLDA